jgi:hypothetical protein
MEEETIFSEIMERDEFGFIDCQDESDTFFLPTNEKNPLILLSVCGKIYSINRETQELRLLQVD